MSKHRTGYPWTRAAGLPPPRGDALECRPHALECLDKTLESNSCHEEDSNFSEYSNAGGADSEHSKHSNAWAEAVKIGISRTAHRAPWGDALFAFARYLKPIALTYGVTADSLGAFENDVRTWHGEQLRIAALARLAKQTRGEAVDPEEDQRPFAVTWGRFLGIFPKVWAPQGKGPLVEAMRLRLSDPHIWPRAIREAYDCPRTCRLLAACWELHQAAQAKAEADRDGNGNKRRRKSTDEPGVWHLSSYLAGDLCEFDQATAYRQLRMLEVDGWIERVGEPTRTRATRYRFLMTLEP